MATRSPAFPQTDARDLLRHFDDAQPEDLIGSWIDIDSRTGAQVARAFEDAGYLQLHSVDGHGETWWESTIKGGALAQASFNRPITRKTAERLLAGVIDRAKRFNADESHLTDITELVVFGSCLRPRRATPWWPRSRSFLAQPDPRHHRAG